MNAEFAGPSVALVFSCLCIAPLVAVVCVILLVWMAKRGREKLPADAIINCPNCGREMPRSATGCPHCGAAAKT